MTEHNKAFSPPIVMRDDSGHIFCIVLAPVTINVGNTGVTLGTLRPLRTEDDFRRLSIVSGILMASKFIHGDGVPLRDAIERQIGTAREHLDDKEKEIRTRLLASGYEREVLEHRGANHELARVTALHNAVMRGMGLGLNPEDVMYAIGEVILKQAEDVKEVIDFYHAEVDAYDGEYPGWGEENARHEAILLAMDRGLNIEEVSDILRGLQDAKDE